VLYRDAYRGLVTWNKTRKRDSWGAHKQADRPAADLITVAAPALQIVDDQSWAQVHARLEAVRGVYMAATQGRPFGRPALGDPSKYLLTNLASCAQCGGPMKVRSRSHGNGPRKHFYGCAGYHDRGRTVCGNGADVPMADADYMVIEALMDDVLDESMLSEGIDEACRLLQGDDGLDERVALIEGRLKTVDQERARLATAIATGGEMEGLLEALRSRERLKSALESDRQAMRAERRLEASEARQVRADLQGLASSWRSVLAGDAINARPIVSSLLIGRVRIEPSDKRRWTISGAGTLAGLFSRVLVPFGVTSPTGSGPEWKVDFLRTIAA
jgi:ssDNA-binding Zn-finger/Zn-ribbon topoisomerase 1